MKLTSLTQPSDPAHGVAVAASSMDRGPRARQATIAWCKVAITVGLLAYLLWQVDLRRVAAAVTSATGGWLVLALVSHSLAFVTSSWKWASILGALGIHLSRWRLLQLYTIGFSLSTVLPGSIGGDVVRWGMTARQTGQHLRVAATILLERLTGVVTLVALAALLVLAAVPGFRTPAVLTLLGAATVIAAAAGVVTMNRRVAVGTMRRFGRTSLGGFVGPMYRLQRAVRLFPMRALVVALGYSIVFYVSVGLTFFLICRAFAAEVTLLEAVTIQALICVVIQVPVTVGGLGVAQAGDIYLLGILGVGAPTALGISLIRVLMRYAYAAVGFLLLLRWDAEGTPLRGTPRQARSPG